MTMTDLNRYKGQFLKGEPEKIKPPGPNSIVHYDNKFEIVNASFSHNGLIPPKKGAI